MSFVRLARPGGSSIAINPDEIVHAAPVPASCALMGPLSTGTWDEVIARTDAVRSARAAAVAVPVPATRATPQDSRS